MKNNTKMSDKEFKNDSNEEHIYYNVNIYNPGDEQIEAIFSQSLNPPLLKNVGRYHVSVIRFSIPMSSSPILVFEYNKWSFTLEYKDNIAQAFFSYIPEYTSEYIDNNSSLPPYYYSYAKIVYMMNLAMIDAFTLLSKKNGNYLPTTNPPYFIFNSVTGMVSLYADTFYDEDVAGVDNYIKIYANTDTAGQFLSGLPISFNGGNPSSINTFGRNYQLNVGDLGNNEQKVINPFPVQVTAPHSDMSSPFYLPDPPFTGHELKAPVSTDGYQMAPDFPNIFTYTSTVGISIISNLPIRGESVPSSQSKGNTDNKSILTDFLIPQGSPDAVVTSLQYLPTAEYRIMDMVGGSDLKNLYIQIYTVDTQGNYNKLYIPPRKQASIKILFRKISNYY